MRNSRKKLKLKYIITTHLNNNKKEYIIITLLFIIGIFLGVLVVNNVHEEQFSGVNNYINGFVEKVKSVESINTINLLKNSIMKNIFIVLAIWFFGTTVIRYSNSIWNFSI